MNKIKFKNKIVLIITCVALVASGLIFFEIYFNSPKRFVERVLIARELLPQNKKVKKYFTRDYFDLMDSSQGAVKTPVHDLKADSNNGKTVVTLSYAIVNTTGANQTDILKITFQRHGLYPLVFWNVIENVELLNQSYKSDFANILPKEQARTLSQGQEFDLNGRLKAAAENFKVSDSYSVGETIVYYQFDLVYKNKPLDFAPFDVYVSLFGKNNFTCAKNEKVSINELKDDRFVVNFPVVGDFCQPDMIVLDRGNGDNINIKI